MRYVWRPEIRRVKRIIVKNARGHVFYECGEPMLAESDYVWTLPLASMTMAEREKFDSMGMAGPLAPWPAELGSRMMTRAVTGRDIRDGWVIVQDGVYRFWVEQCSGTLVRSVLFEYLATEVYWSDY